jgi:[ribosomal protein S18]-alanine N-acetyltransferase
MAARPIPSTPSLLDVRPAVVEDIYAVYMLNCKSFLEAWSVMALALWQERGDDLDVCYTANGELVAYYLGQNVLDEVHIMQIAVEPRFRRCGLGRHLMLYEIERKRTAGMTQMLLEVRHSNTAAQRLYTSLGFRVVGRRSDYYAPIAGRPAEDALLMNFRL